MNSVPSMPEFRVIAVSYFLQQVVEQSTWVAIILYAYDRNGARSAGILTSIMSVGAALAGPFQARLLEHRHPFKAAAVQFGSSAIITLGAALVFVVEAPTFFCWAALGLIAFSATTGPSVLYGLIPSTARNAQSLAAQSAQMGWMESAAMIVGPISAAGIFSLTNIRFGVVVLLALGGLFTLAGWLLLRPYAHREQALLKSENPLSEVIHPQVSRQSELSLLRLPALRTLAVLTLGAYLTIGALDVLMVPVAAQAGMSEKRAGFLAGVYGCGALLAFAVSRRIVGRPRLVIPLLATGMVGSLALALLAITDGQVLVAFVLVAVAGAGRSVFTALHRVLLQRSSPAGSLLRVSGLFQVLVTLGYGAGVLVPWLAGTTAWACIATGLLLPVAMLITSRSLSDIDRAANVPVTEIALLQQVSILRSLQPASLEALARQCEVRAYVDEVVIQQGENGTEMFVIIDGQAAVDQDDHTAVHRHIRTMGRGEVFGEIALMRQQPRSATVAAVGQLRVLVVPGENFVELVGIHSGLASAVDGLLLQRP
jgi:hypothetical protein